MLDPNAASPIKDATDETFMADVIEASNDTPVLVDFWAPWCGPCKSLTPVLEKVVNSENGKVKLVKINIDENPGIAGQMGVRSIPAVFAFDKGRPVDGFQGALPNGDIAGAAQLYSNVIEADQTHPGAIAGLARCYLANGDTERASQILDMAPEDKQSDSAIKSVRTAIELMADAPLEDDLSEARGAVEAAPDNHDARFDLAEKLIAKGKNKDAADHLLIILSSDLDWSEGKAKAKLLEIFEAAGPKDPVTVEGRRRLGSLMFA